MLKISKNSQESANTTQIIILSQAIRGVEREELYNICYANAENICLQIRSLERKGYIEEGWCEGKKQIVITDLGIDFWKFTCKTIHLLLTAPQN